MATLLSYLATTLTLSDHLLWADEFAWEPVLQQQQYSITGAAVFTAQAKQAGRPITLSGGANYGWVPRAAVETLLAWAQVAGAELSLTYRGVVRSVVFDHARTGLEARAVVDYSNPAAGDHYVVTLRFLEV